ncbi:MAG: gamma-glutamyltranspeptidase/glutathione hydrolase, partial [Alphaproteobacteria bacterium]
MLQTHRSYRGMVTAPHHLAARAGLRVLEDGGDAIEAMVAAAAAIAVVYPHMNGLGGDNFWLIHTPGEPVIGIDACGAAAGLADTAYYTERGLAAIPSRGPDAALTMAGAVSGWREALKVGRENGGGALPLSRLFEDAIHYARDGVSVTKTQAANTAGKLGELRDASGFADTFLINGAPPQEGARFRQSRLADTLAHLAEAGLDDFYRGDLARSLSGNLERAGSPLRLADFERHTARRTKALKLLYLSSGRGRRFWRTNMSIYFTYDVAFQASNNLTFG